MKDAADYFEQTCRLAAEPLRVIAAVRAAGGGMAAIEAALGVGGFAVWPTPLAHAEVLLSACAGRDGVWKLARQNAFAATCGGSERSASAAVRVVGDRTSQAPLPGGAPACVRSQHGPQCTADHECAGLSGCLRCARSGFCTDVPLSGGRRRSS